MKLLCIVAHPDDASIFCGGTIAKHADNGDSIKLVYMTDGSLGGSGEPEEDIETIRRGEAKEAADVLGATTEFLGYKDGHLSEEIKIRFELVEMIQQAGPDIVLTHFENDPHPDHQATSKLVTDAANLVSNCIPESNYTPTHLENIYYFGTPQAGFSPDIIVDISTYQEQKLEAISKHCSQVERFNRRGISLTNQVSSEMEVLGRQSGIEYAEGFSSLKPMNVGSLQ